MSARIPATAALFVFLAAHVAAEARELSFADRVEAQEAIERVYHGHQIGTTKSFEEAVPREVLERKVRTYLKQSAALEKYWHTPVTAEMLERELERIADGTRMPDRLGELFAALDHDPFLIQETLVRATLVGRLSHDFYAFDARFHQSARDEAEALHEALSNGTLDPWHEHPRRSEVELLRQAETEPAGRDPLERGAVDGDEHVGPSRHTVSSERFDRSRERLLGAPGGVWGVEENRDALHVNVLLEQSDGYLRLAAYRFEKASWDAWWTAVESDLTEVEVAAVASSDVPVPDPTAALTRSCVDDDTWDNGSMAELPEARWSHTAVWTGTWMLVWGGENYGDGLDTGGRYDPATHTWTPMTTTGAPTPRSLHTAVWTGGEMIVWGGESDLSGGRYDPVADTWAPTSTVGAPAAYYRHTAVWTGDEMIVWGGGSGSGGGGRYDPVRDLWAATSTTDAPPPRRHHTAVWTGTTMLVWGGRSPYPYQPLDTGGRYDPATDTWTAITETGAPSPREGHTAVWIDGRMVIWGGGFDEEDHVRTGGRYDPVTDSWTATTLVGAPFSRLDHTAVVADDRMLVWGGLNALDDELNTGAQYVASTDTWTTMSTASAPVPRTGHSAVWTGSLMVVWGGDDDGGSFPGDLDTGGRYDPASDTWTSTSPGGAPAARRVHTSVWTGNHMIVWGGQGSTYDNLQTGGRYDPVTDGWTPTSVTGAPSPRAGHTAVWTGDSMIVWGGGTHTGGIYDPIDDTWTFTIPTGAPSARSGHTAVWTGTRMVVWGGSSSNTGGRYDPATGVWTPTTLVGAPAGRFRHTAVWTGSRMIVWGGYSFGDTDTGGQYDPVADTWTATSTVGAPEARDYHTAVWTGDVMVVWGGLPGTPTDTGGRYDPAGDTWTATSLSDAPSGRFQHAAVWTGDTMVAWGGQASGSDLDTGGRYDPVADTWTATAVVGAPPVRHEHTAIWTGSHMIVWGGDGDGGWLDTGGRYALGHTSDDDGDGYSECDGDCNDGNPAVSPDAVELCDGLDNNCSGEADGPAELDPDADGIRTCDGDCAPDDGGAFALPAEVTGLAFSDRVTLFWASAAPDAGADTLHDVARGPLGVPVGSGVETCVAPGTADATATDAGIPDPAAAYWYLARGRNVCGAGSYGSSTAGAERITEACP